MKAICEQTMVLTSAAFEVGCFKKFLKEHDEQVESLGIKSVTNCLYSLIVIRPICCPSFGVSSTVFLSK